MSQWHRDSKLSEESRGELDVGVLSSSELKILEGEVRLIGVCHIDFWTGRTAIGVQARLVCLNSLPALLLTAILHFAENASLAIEVGIAALVIQSPGWLGLRTLQTSFARLLWLKPPWCLPVV
jgi:hypothetical protein